MSITQSSIERDQVTHRTDGGTGEGDESLAIAVFEAIAEQHDDTEMPPVQLYDHIDPEAVEQLLAHAETREQSEWELTVTVKDVTVTVTSEGEITVR